MELSTGIPHTIPQRIHVMSNFARKLRNWLFKDLVRQSDLDVLYTQIAGHFQIQNSIYGGPILRPLRGWAISPDAIAWVLAALQERSAPTLVEFGSGQSTVILSSVLKRHGGRLLSVEHDLGYLETIRRQIGACELSEKVEFFHSPLRPNESLGGQFSYDVTILPDVPIDIALIDGPPSANALLTRLPPLRWSVRHLKPGGSVFLDDTLREGEQACLQHIQKEFSNLKMLSRETEKGLVEIVGLL